MSYSCGSEVARTPKIGSSDKVDGAVRSGRGTASRRSAAAISILFDARSGDVIALDTTASRVRESRRAHAEARRVSQAICESALCRPIARNSAQTLTDL